MTAPAQQWAGAFCHPLDVASMQLPTIDHDQLPPGVTLTRAAPRNPRAKFPPPEWDVWLESPTIAPTTESPAEVRSPR